MSDTNGVETPEDEIPEKRFGTYLWSWKHYTINNTLTRCIILIFLIAMLSTLHPEALHFVIVGANEDLTVIKIFGILIALEIIMNVLVSFVHASLKELVDASKFNTLTATVWITMASMLWFMLNGDPIWPETAQYTSIVFVICIISATLLKLIIKNIPIEGE